jgi:hypothetical protein
MMSDRSKPSGPGVVYIRTSDDSQDASSQRKSCQDYLDLHGLRAEWEVDAGFARWDADKRPAWQRIIANAKRYKWVLVAAFDRAACKDHWEFSHYVHLLRKAGCELWDASGTLLSDPGVMQTVMASISSARSNDDIKSRAEKACRGGILRATQGRFQGGTVPWGFDAVAQDALGTERWRAVRVGPKAYVREYPDGRRTPCAALPRHDRDEVVVLAPTRDARQIEWIRTAFRLYATTHHSVNAVARILNEIGADCVAGKHYGTRLAETLRNPLYLRGSTTYGKRSKAKVVQIMGASSPLAPIGDVGETKTRVRAPEHHVHGPARGEPIIDESTFATVRAKLIRVKKTGRQPKSSTLFLSGLLRCSCGARLAGWKGGPYQPAAYMCDTKRRLGPHSPCRGGRITHAVAEGLIARWLEQSEERAAAVLAFEQAGGDTPQLRDRVRAAWGKGNEYLALLAMMASAVEAETGIPASDDEGRDAYDLRGEYRGMMGRKREGLARRIGEGEERLRCLARSLAVMKSEAAIRAVEQEIQAEQDTIDAARAEMEPLDERAEEALADLRRVKASLAEVREAMAGGTARRHEALRLVLAGMVVHWSYTQHGRQQRCHIEKVIFEPVSGQPETVGTGPSFRGECAAPPPSSMPASACPGGSGRSTRASGPCNPSCSPVSPGRGSRPCTAT